MISQKTKIEEEDDEDTFSAREGSRGGAGGKQSTWVARPSLGSHGGRTIQFIHSCPPHPHTVYLLLLSPPSLPTYTHTVSTQRRQLRTHPLSHIITRPLWKCVSLQTLDVTTSRSPPGDRWNKRGLVMAAKESHPTHYYYSRPIHSLQMPLWGSETTFACDYYYNWWWSCTHIL